MNGFHSFRFQLTVLHLLTLVAPTIIIIYFMPNYFKGVIIENVTSETERSVAAISRNIETYLDELEKLTITPYLNDEFMKALTNRVNARGIEKEAATAAVNHYLDTSLRNYMKMARTDILGTTMIFSDGTSSVKSMDLSDPVKHYPFDTRTWYTGYPNIVQADGRIVFIGAHTEEYWMGRPSKTVFSVARVIKDLDNQKSLATIIADADARVFEPMVKETHFQVNSMVAIVDENLKPLYTSAPIEESLLQKLSENEAIISGDSGRRYLLVKNKLNQTDWYVAVWLPYSELQSKFRWVYIVGILFGIGGLSLTVIVFSIQSRRTVQPFQEMIAVMRRVQYGQLDGYVNVRGKDEIAQLGVAMNTMINRLNQLIEREYRAELRLREAELRSLQAQINPHFLYNVLSGLLGLNRQGRQEEIETVILSLSHMMRYVLSKKDNICLKQELDLLKSYCELQKMRLGRRGFSYRIVCAPELENLLIPKLLLQPLVENAFIHGIEPVFRPCELSVTASVEVGEDGEWIAKLLVADTGNGFAEEESLMGNHMGLQNVSDRLKLTFGGAAFHIRSKRGEGTEIELTIPLQVTNMRREVKA